MLIQSQAGNAPGRKKVHHQKGLSRKFTKKLQLQAAVMGRKRSREEEAVAKPEKKSKLLDEESEEEDGFKINEDFANRFEHNNKRKELQQCEYSIIRCNPKIMRVANVFQWRRSMGRTT